MGECGLQSLSTCLIFCIFDSWSAGRAFGLYKLGVGMLAVVIQLELDAKDFCKYYKSSSCHQL